MSTLERAISIAAEAHGKSKQVDKAGAPYILHPLRVMMAMNTIEEMMVGVLHDVVEDTEWTLDTLRAEGFSEDVLESIEALTHRSGETYDGYVQRIKKNPTARCVKLADLADNMDLDRLPEISDKDLERLNKYKRAKATLAEESQ